MRKAILSWHSPLTDLFGPARSPERAMKILGSGFTLCGLIGLGAALDVLLRGVGATTSLFCGLIGLVFLGGGFGFLIVPPLRRRKRQHIRLMGIPVKAKVVEIRQDTAFGLQTIWDDWSPWVIRAEAIEEFGKKAIFASHYLWVNPEVFFPIGSEVTVYRHPGKSTAYAFQFEELSEAV